MNRRNFLIGGSALTAATLTAGSSYALSNTRAFQSGNQSFQVTLGRPIKRLINDIQSASSGQRQIVSDFMQRSGRYDDFNAMRVQAALNVNNSSWVNNLGRQHFSNRRARRAFASWLPDHMDSSKKRPLTQVMVHGGEAFTVPVVLAWVSVAMAFGASWDELQDEMTQLSGGLISLVKTGAGDLANGTLTGVYSTDTTNSNLTINISSSGPARSNTLQKSDMTKVFRKRRGIFGWLAGLFSAAAAGFAIGSVFGLGGAIIGAIIFGAAYAESTLGDGGGSNGVWAGDRDNPCPPESDPNVLC